MQHAASAIIINNKKILLIKRTQSSPMFPGYWTLPGGRSEGDETSRETVTREVREEMDLDFVPTELFHTSSVEYLGENLKTHRFLGSYSGNITLQEDECDGYAWFAYSEALALPLAFDYRELIELLFEKNFL